MLFSTRDHCSISAKMVLPTVLILHRVNNVTLAFNKVCHALLYAYLMPNIGQPFLSPACVAEQTSSASSC